ncbi:MAG: ribosome-associated translation inhibitor RaiA [Duncaniella sp.]|jgi:putative sigma-54 modulation protein|uniref:ribosome hibernation-promoting factor, HPF/YfiA family n=1 Tax=Duncaniella muricolitica TaxID=2880704 RepID=UPI000AEEAD15|nr:ribosome-associated translation inhibitor RaiA [Duncaniella muricolitica]MCX4369278.1 ribosome-associated translation inhibitor RaiA [Duncaniella sp.]ROT20016.1 ribosome-associated translation inhibitor RaiA [Muribaculaceae bacterium Isolate-110 (HZI)]
MDINIKAIHFDITEKLTAFINKKVERIVRRFPSVSTVDISLKVVKPETALNKQAIVRLTVPQLEEFVADKTADTFEEAIDVALDAIEKQLEKAKNKK